MKTIKRVYISGKITGKDNFMDDFIEAEKEVRKMGADVVNPARVNAQMPKLTWSEYMIMSLAMLSLCDTIYMIPGWECSKGALIEHKYAQDNKLNVIYG